MLPLHQLAETVIVVTRLWAPDGPDPEVVITEPNWKPTNAVRFFYTNTNSMMRRLSHGAASRIVLFVDQRVRRLNADGMITMITGEDADWDGIVSPCVEVDGDDDAQPWHEPICPYAWACRGFVLGTLRPAWEQHLQFGHETLMADAAVKAEIEMVCNLRSAATVEYDGPATAVASALYYRQLEDAATVANVLGVEGPSA